MHERLFSFRWDIDHRACMTDGVPVIGRVCREYGVRHTFFVNMGRSTNFREWIGKGFAGSRHKFRDTESVNLVRKIGWPRFALETLLSRPVGRSFTGALQALQADGHELGLHGGSDHVIWSRRFAELTEAEIADDVATTLADFESRFGRPAGFTSPGFKSDERIMSLVERLGFDYHGDAIGGAPAPTSAGGRRYDHWTVPVSICGPRTIPFLEWHAAKATPEADVLREFENHLLRSDTAILYGHPCFEWRNESMLRSLFDIVLEHGYRFVTHAELVDRLKAGSMAGSTAESAPQPARETAA